ncbi:hypothetical protein IWW34DRAFT_676719 [Fusarium oxysporum f. sp. albedinis]|nr:hypothetical protein IWW34DRAFT_676719 [Fusarium oxysporum f. sp. albedinis]KAJ0127460.1 Uncharacterized protein HZ326_29435 [Fusarium oxysporum f. sp. albedinis]KAK2469946.1 hypothetical protein H9L39_18410 [Fusarium oxysporum f. sp. albedinis]
MATEKLLRQFGNIKETVAQYDSKLSSIKSPAVIYEEKTAAIRARITQLWSSLASAPRSEIPRLQENVVELGGQLKELEVNHKTKIQGVEKIYNQTLQKTLDILCYKIMGIIGPAKIQSYLHTSSSETSIDQDSNYPVGTFQSPAPTPRGSVVEEAIAPTEVIEDKHPRHVASLSGDKRKRDSPKPTRRKRRRIDEEYYHTEPESCHVSSSVARSSRRQTRHRHRRCGDNRSNWDENFEGITDPDAGSVYLAFWEKSKEWLAVLLLPMQDLQSIGISGSMESLGLAEVLPACYDNKGGNLFWAEGYNDGEPLVAEREFPVMYFDGQDFPAKSAVGWVAAKDLRDFDAKSKNSLVPHIKSVRKFLKTRAANHSPEHETDETGTEIPDTTGEQPIELNTNSAMLLDVQHEPHEAHSSASERDQGESEHPPVTQPTPPSSNQVPRSSSLVQSRSLPGSLDEEEQKHQPDLEVFSISIHRSEEQPDEPLGLSEPRPLTTPVEVTQETCQDANPIRLCRGDGENRTAALGEAVETGPSEASRLAQAALDVACPPNSLQRGQSLVNQGPQSLEEVERRPSEPVPSSTFDPITTPVAYIQSATLLAQQQQHARPGMGGTHSSPSINHATHPTREEGQPAHRSSSVAETRSERLGVVLFDMPQLRPMLSGTEHPSSSLTGTLCNPEASKTSRSLPPIGSILGQDMSCQPPLQGLFGQAPTDTDQLFSLCASPIQAPPVPLAANTPPSPHTRLPTTQPITQSPAVQPSSSPPSSTHHPANHRPKGQNYDSLGVPASSLMPPTKQHHFASPGVPTTHVSDGNNTQFPCDLGVAYPKADWYKKLPRDLTDYLEKYQRDNNICIGMDGLRIQSGHYVCPFCSDSKRKPYTRPGPFSSHLARHWAIFTK